MTRIPPQTETEPAGAEVSRAFRVPSKCFERLRQMAAWIESHPRKAQWIAVLLVLIVAGIETNYWPSHDFPGAYWHKSPRGDDIELAQANAAKAGWTELWGYWSGPMIHGHGYYRPLTSWLFVFQYRLFGTADGKWAFLNIALHLAVCALLVSAGGLLAGGSATRRLTIGTAAALLLGAPVLADRTIQFWICGWWPCQSEMLSLLGGLTLLGAIVRFVETGRGRWLALGVGAMILGILCKEMTYVAALGACLLLMRHPKRWWGGVAIVLPALALFTFRKWAIRNVAKEGGIPLGDLVEHTLFEATRVVDQLLSASMHFAALGVAILLAGVFLRRSGLAARGAVALVVYLGLVSQFIGLPWELAAQMGYVTVFQSALGVAVLFGLARVARKWPVPELCVIWALTQLPALGFPPIFAWYRYWGDVFGSLLIAIAVWEVIAWGSGRLNLCPTQSTPQTLTSRLPEAGGPLATGPSAA